MVIILAIILVIISNETNKAAVVTMHDSKIVVRVSGVPFRWGPVSHGAHRILAASNG